MRWIPFTLIVLAAAILDAGNLVNLIAFSNGQVRPEFMVTLLVFFAFQLRPEFAVPAAFIVGLGADLATGVMGPYTVCYLLAGSLLAQSRGMLLMRYALLQAGMVFGVCLFTNLLAFWLAEIKTNAPAGLPLGILFARCFYTALAAPLIWLALKALWKRVEPPVTEKGSRIHV